MNAKNTTTAKPKSGGAVYRAPIGTDLPTDAVTNLGDDYKELGYCSDDGLTNAIESESQDFKAWGGDVVDSQKTSTTVTLKLKLIEALNVETLKAVFGEENVSGSLDTGIHVKVNSKDVEESSWVVDMAMRDGAIKRIVIPDVKVSEISEIAYKHDEQVGYEVTLKALVDENGNYQDEYIIRESEESDS